MREARTWGAAASSDAEKIAGRIVEYGTAAEAANWSMLSWARWLIPSEPAEALSTDRRVTCSIEPIPAAALIAIRCRTPSTPTDPIAMNTVCYRSCYLNIQRLNYLWTIRHSSARIAGNLVT